MNRLLDNLSDKKQVINYYQKKRGLKEIYSMTMADNTTEQIISLQGLNKYILKS